MAHIHFNPSGLWQKQLHTHYVVFEQQFFGGIYLQSLFSLFFTMWFKNFLNILSTSVFYDAFIFKSEYNNWNDNNRNDFLSVASAAVASVIPASGLSGNLTKSTDHSPDTIRITLCFKVNSIILKCSVRSSLGLDMNTEAPWIYLQSCMCSQTHTGHRCILIATWGIHGPSCLLPGLHWTCLQVQRWPPASVLAAGWRQPRRSE